MKEGLQHTDILRQNGIEFTVPLTPEAKRVLTPEVLIPTARLEREFRSGRLKLLNERDQKQERIDAGELPDFLKETKEIRESEWIVAPIAHDLRDRRIEITGPASDRKMVINALNSGANDFMADFEDSNSPTWENTINGQQNLIDAISGSINYISPEGKQYLLKDKTAVLMMRPRGWHMEEKHILIDGKPAAASIIDFGMYFFGNIDRLIDKKTGAYLYLPKMQGHKEARLWSDVFDKAVEIKGVKKDNIKATSLLEHINAAFEMNEILYELKDYSAGLNCGRWDYLFSFIKTFKNYPNFVLPDCDSVSMTAPFMKAYVDKLIQTCHRRGAHAMGGMAAQIPLKNPEANKKAMEKVTADKLREVKAGHDGTWIAHPGLVPLAKNIFDFHMPGENQIDLKREDVNVSRNDLLTVPQGKKTEAGLRNNINIGTLYTYNWLGGTGAAAINGKMEDLATAEIRRTQIAQWLKHKAIIKDSIHITPNLVRDITLEEELKLRQVLGDSLDVRRLNKSAALFTELALDTSMPDFMSTALYKELP